MGVTPTLGRMGALVEPATRVNVEVNGGVNVYVAVNLNGGVNVDDKVNVDD